MITFNGLQELTINNKFATLSESLYIAERKASEDLRVRNQIRKKMAIREQEDKEAELRELANRARAERSGMMGGSGGAAQLRRCWHYAALAIFFRPI